MKTARDQLESYPLAKQYGWRLPKADTGGILYLFPPSTNGAGRSKADGTRKSHVIRDRLEAIHPHDLHMSAMEATEFLHSRIPFRQKRLRRAKRNTKQEVSSEHEHNGAVFEQAQNEEQKVNKDRQTIAAN